MITFTLKPDILAFLGTQLSPGGVLGGPMAAFEPDLHADIFTEPADLVADCADPHPMRALLRRRSGSPMGHPDSFHCKHLL